MELDEHVSADGVVFFAVVDRLRGSGLSKLTESDLDFLHEEPKLQYWLSTRLSPMAALQAVALRASKWLEEQADHILTVYMTMDIASLRPSDRQVLEAVYRLGLHQGTRVLASSRYLEVIVPNFTYRTIQNRSPKLAELGYFKFFHGKSSTPWQRTNLDSSNVYELVLVAPEAGESPEYPTGLEPLTEDELAELKAFQTASARRKKTKPPRRIKVKPPALETTMTLADIKKFHDDS